MFTVKTNEKNNESFQYKNIKDFSPGFFYEDASGNRYLILSDERTFCNYAICISVAKYDCKTAKVGRLYGGFDSLNLRLVEPGTEFTFTQTEPIPF